MSKYICSDCLNKFDEPFFEYKFDGVIERKIAICPDCGSINILSTRKSVSGLKSVLDWMKENGL